jgi:hypothetical protein
MRPSSYLIKDFPSSAGHMNFIITHCWLRFPVAQSYNQTTAIPHDAIRIF